MAISASSFFLGTIGRCRPAPLRHLVAAVESTLAEIETRQMQQIRI